MVAVAGGRHVAGPVVTSLALDSAGRAGRGDGDRHRVRRCQIADFRARLD